MNRMMVLSGAAVLTLAFASGAQADPRVLNCYNGKGEATTCQVNYPDGYAAGADFARNPTDPVKVDGGKANGHEFPLLKTSSDEHIVVIAAPSLLSGLPSADVSAASPRPGLDGDWVSVAPVDRLDKMKQWQQQFLGEVSPVIDNAESNFDR
jgi:hypothetical protein